MDIQIRKLSSVCELWLISDGKLLRLLREWGISPRHTCMGGGHSHLYQPAEGTILVLIADSIVGHDSNQVVGGWSEASDGVAERRHAGAATGLDELANIVRVRVLDCVVEVSAASQGGRSAP